jgi:hypothetical protein
MCLLTMALAGFAFPAPRAIPEAGIQETTVEELIKQLNAGDFVDQGKAAKSLDRMGRAVLQHLRRVHEDPATAGRVRTWCQWIIEKIESRDKRFRELIEKLGSGDDEVKEAAEEELRRSGQEAVPYLLDLRKSEDKNLKRRAERLLRELESELEILTGEAKMGPAVDPPLKREAAKGESSVLAALNWLARHQNPDGSWGAGAFANQCVGKKCQGSGDPEFDAGLTGLALLAFLGAGYSHLSKDEFPDPVTPARTLKFGEVVKNGLKWLLVKQDAAGCIGGRGTKYMYNHTIAAAALAEAYGMSATALFKGAAQRAIDFIVAAQNPGRGWRYVEQSGDNDTSVTGWAVLALKSAESAELRVPVRAAYEAATQWLDEVTDATLYYRAGYNGKSSGKVFVPGKNETFSHHETMTAVAVSSRIFMEKSTKNPALGGVALLVKDLPEWKEDNIDFYYWYHASMALFQFDGPDGPYWKKWNEPMKNAIVPHQKKEGCAAGSWTSEEERWGFEGGRVYAAAINALTLETYYRYPTPRSTRK